MIELVAAPDHDDLPGDPGGFCWWYVDLVTPEGDGAVVIWGFALPFLEPPTTLPAAARPFVNLAVYRQGLCTGYWLEELDPAEVRPIPGGWELGRCRFQTRRGGRVEVDGELILATPGGTETRARLRVEGAALRGAPTLDTPHRWSPVTVGHGSVVIEGGARIEGRAYHDRNTSDVPLQSLGIREWAWGRVAEPGGDRVHYALWPDEGEARVLDVRLGLDGRVEFVEGAFSATGSAGGWWGLDVPAELTITGVDLSRVRAGTPVDDSPFYARFPLSTDAGRGWGERVRPGSIGRWWMRPFVRMRVLAPTDRSVLAPWFLGPRESRLDRLWRSWCPTW